MKAVHDNMQLISHNPYIQLIQFQIYTNETYSNKNLIIYILQDKMKIQYDL